MATISGEPSIFLLPSGNIPYFPDGYQITHKISYKMYRNNKLDL